MNNSLTPAIAKSEANRPFGNVRCLSEKSPEHCVKIIYSKWRIRKIRIRRVRRNISSALKPVKLKGEQAKCIEVPLFQSTFHFFFPFFFSLEEASFSFGSLPSATASFFFSARRMATSASTFSFSAFSAFSLRTLSP